MKFDVAIIGGGINGLATAFHLSHQNSLKIALIEQFNIGHAFGSSHGFSRIFRTTYSNPIYTELARRAVMHEWPDMEAKFGCPLLYPRGRCVFGSGASFERYVQTALKHDSQQEIELFDVSIAKKYFPQFTFFDSKTVLYDNASKLIAAQSVVDHLSLFLEEKENVSLFQKTKVLKINHEKKRDKTRDK